MFSILRCCKNLQPSTYTKIPTRNFVKVSERMETLLKKSDRVPQNYKLVYRVLSHRGGAFMYHSLTFMTCMSMGTLGVFYYKDWGVTTFSNVDGPQLSDLTDSPWKIVVFIVSSLTILSFAAKIRSRYAIRIYFHEKSQTYQAIFIGKVPFALEKYEFPSKLATFVDKNSILPWKRSLIYANGRKIMVFDVFFRTPYDFMNMLKPGQVT